MVKTVNTGFLDNIFKTIKEKWDQFLDSKKQAKEQAKLDADQVKADAEKRNEILGNLEGSLTDAVTNAGTVTEQQAQSNAANQASQMSSQMRQAGLGKAQSATLGTGAEAVTAADTYNKNIAANEEAAYKQAIMKAAMELQAAGGTQQAANLMEAASLQSSAQGWEGLSNALSVLNEGTRLLSGLRGDE